MRLTSGCLYSKAFSLGDIKKFIKKFDMQEVLTFDKYLSGSITFLSISLGQMEIDTIHFFH